MDPRLERFLSLFTCSLHLLELSWWRIHPNRVFSQTRLHQYDFTNSIGFLIGGGDEVFQTVPSVRNRSFTSTLQFPSAGSGLRRRDHFAETGIIAKIRDSKKENNSGLASRMGLGEDRGGETASSL